MHLRGSARAGTVRCVDVHVSRFLTWHLESDGDERQVDTYSSRWQVWY